MLVTELSCCMSGRGPRGSNGTCSALCWFSVTPPATHNEIGPLWCCFLGGWVCVHSRTLWVSPMNSPVRLGVSPAATSTPTGAFSQSFEALFPQDRVLGCVVCHLVTSCSLAHPTPRSATSLGLPAAALPQVLPARAAHLRPSYCSG